MMSVPKLMTLIGSHKDCLGALEMLWSRISIPRTQSSVMACSLWPGKLGGVGTLVGQHPGLTRWEQGQERAWRSLSFSTAYAGTSCHSWLLNGGPESSVIQEETSHPLR